jgi:HEAT repeat protein
MRQCAFETPEIFLQEGLRILLEADDSASYRFLAILLAANPSIGQEISDRWQWKREEAIALGQILIRANPNFDTRISNLLPSLQDDDKPFGIDVESAERALEILDEISPGRRIVSMIKHLTAHPHERISSKVALLIGKRSKDASWGRRILKNATDARLRANTIESLWGTNTPDVIELFHECLRDSDNRVVGNAIVGLHTSGDPSSLKAVLRIAGDSNPRLRMTAAWAMGRIGDPSFISVLTGLARDQDGDVRRTALRSLRHIHVAETEAKRAARVDAETAPEAPSGAAAAPRVVWAPAGLGLR